MKIIGFAFYLCLFLIIILEPATLMLVFISNEFRIKVPKVIRFRHFCFLSHHDFTAFYCFLKKFMLNFICYISHYHTERI